MTDWIRIDYTDQSTWPSKDQRIEGLRWIAEGVPWIHAEGAVRYVNLPGFPIPGTTGEGFGMAPGTLWRYVETPEDGYPPTPVTPTDWWRPLEEPE